MINDLKYAVTFPINGVSLAGEFSFQPGATAITGDNGAGKSFVAEMIRYGLFGKKALRGPASDYKTLDMEMSFLGYRVKRAKKEELVDANGAQLAVGADAVNKKIIEILGFDLEVFDVVCAANQKESERLTRLTPAKRKELIDEVVGLTRQEAVEKACKDEAKANRIEAEALTRALVTPVEPVKPEGYRPSAEIKAELDETVSLLAQRVKLQRIVDAVPAEPIKPLLPRPDIAELEAHENARRTQENNFASLQRELSKIPVPTLTKEQLDAADAIASYEQHLATLGDEPWIDEPSLILKEMLDKWDEIDTLRRLGNLELDCPKCKHHFCPATDIPELPEYSRAMINAELAARTRWGQAPKRPKGQSLSPEQRLEGRLALAGQARRQEIISELEVISNNLMEDKSVLLAEARRLDREWDLYDAEQERHTNAVIAAEDAQAKLTELPAPKHAPEDLNHDYTAAVVYERELARYEADRERYDKLSKEIAEKQERSEAFTAGAKGLVEARRTLKAFLAPSLSRVATKIIQQMTVNALRPLEDITVDEDMNITADGQDVSTFNGAHATMINLALRLALGQVLVARVLPLFIGDEIDSDATPANAQAIADGLMACKEQLKQIVLISHKRLEGVDHEVML
jgi:DNA repair exonuclease SbcCD ATPase subunit